MKALKNPIFIQSITLCIVVIGIMWNTYKIGRLEQTDPAPAGPSSFSIDRAGTNQSDQTRPGIILVMTNDAQYLEVHQDSVAAISVFGTDGSLVATYKDTNIVQLYDLKPAPYVVGVTVGSARSKFYYFISKPSNL